MTTKFYDIVVNVDDQFPPLPAKTAGGHWNGWEMPLFALETVRVIAEVLERDADDPDASLITIDDEGVWELNKTYADGYGDPRGSKIDPIVIDGVDYYGAGDSWTWHIDAAMPKS